MNNNDFSINNKIEFMQSCNITPNQYEIIIGVLMAQDEDVYWLTEKYKTEQCFPSHVPNVKYLITLQNLIGKIELREELIKLQEKGIILKTCKLPTPDGGEGIRPNDIKFNKNILSRYLKHSGELFWELFNTYPSQILVNNRYQSARNLAGAGGGWSNLDEAASFYGQRIKYNIKTHNHIIKLINEAKDKDLISMGLMKFLRGEEWRTLEEMVDSMSSVKFK